jgi:hypothetical protein
MIDEQTKPQEKSLLKKPVSVSPHRVLFPPADDQSLHLPVFSFQAMRFVKTETEGSETPP